ncbi:MAG: arginyltransferase [Rhodospirillaceae bacterium]|nr:arginyltransferase [Rhodospirillaceae bacterium]|tara:strand:- start:199 stop:960 length:762 start_codon:yes stop_codon:yes gene_type:complete
MTTQAPKRPLVFYRTGPMPCPYLDGRVERNLFTELRGGQAQNQHDQLALAGFRRSHHMVYRPACPGCNGCVPIRIPVAAFGPSRSQQRVWNRNADLRVNCGGAIANYEQYNLFFRYQRARHAGSEMAAMSFSDFRAMIEESMVETELMSLRHPDGTLLGACLIDVLSTGLSAVYSYFEPAADRRSLGTYSVLRLVQEARARALDHVYLGYWIEDCAKMTYKSRFRSIQHLSSNGWTDASLPGKGTPVDEPTIA